MVVTRLSRAERKQQTRQALLDAGRELFVREGFHRTTLDRVATEAGFTKGAVYASFPTKAELFLAIFEQRIDERIARLRRLAASVGSFDEAAAAFGRDWERTMRSEHEWSLLLIEFWVHAARDEGLRERLAEQRRRFRTAVEELVRGAGGEHELRMEVEEFVAAQLALGNGMNLEALLDPSVGAARFGRIADALLRGARR